MAKIDRSPHASGPIVRGFSGRGFVVDNQVYPQGVMLTPEWARNWDAPPLDALGPAAVAVLAIEPPPEFLLLGTGATLRRPPAEFIAALEARDIGVEAMDSRAAARTWGVLRAEERWIVAALMPL